MLKALQKLGTAKNLWY